MEDTKKEEKKEEPKKEEEKKEAPPKVEDKKEEPKKEDNKLTAREQRNMIEQVLKNELLSPYCNLTKNRM